MARYTATVEIVLDADSQAQAERIVLAALNLMNDSEIDEVVRWEVEADDGPVFDETADRRARIIINPDTL